MIDRPAAIDNVSDSCTAEGFAHLCRMIGKSENRDPLHVAFDYWNYAVTHAIELRRAKDEHDKLCQGENRL